MISKSSIGVVPGVNIVRRPIHFFFLVDISTSMLGLKLGAVNQGIPASLDIIKQTLRQRPEVEAFLRVITFGSTASWHIGPEPKALLDVEWTEIQGGGKTRTGQAINLLCDELEVDRISARGYPPVCILISDGFRTDSSEYYDGAIERLNNLPWGKKAIRLVLAIGNENHYDTAELVKFSNAEKARIIPISKYKLITKHICWATKTATICVTKARSLTGEPAESIHASFPELPDLERYNI